MIPDAVYLLDFSVSTLRMDQDGFTARRLAAAVVLGCARQENPMAQCKRAAVVFAVGIAVANAAAQQPASGVKVLKVEDYLNYETVADPQISPDGAQSSTRASRSTELEDNGTSICGS